jgi:hypothetical protein
MKHFRVFIFTALVCLVLIGCPDPILIPVNDSPHDYYYEYFIISKENFHSEPWPESKDFDATRDHKDRLKSHIIGDLVVGADYTQERLYNFLLQIGASSTEANSIISEIDTIGNTIIWFTLKDNDTDYGVLYLRKL